ncbi:uncharacterized protein LOC107860195 [Capsicum annuum]|uniref:uncharacterized protein LOC107860195 n=1 Tax=Capsicum annuum TaxID=4072 RepID=UPI001FB0EF16|nr:uncharacterized protein LOC107860195 [Capsicum annuum]
MKAYLKDLNLWDIVERGEPFVQPLRDNPTLNDIKKYDELVTRSPRSLTCIHSSLMEVMFTRIMACDITKEAWDKLNEEFEGSNRVKSIKVLALKWEFDLLNMKDLDSVKEYSAKLMDIVNKIRILAEMISKLQIQDQQVTTRSEGIVEDAFQVRHKFKKQNEGKKVSLDHSGEVKFGGYQSESSRKGKFPPCGICKKTNHLDKNCWQKSKRSSIQCRYCKKYGHIENYYRQKQTGQSYQQVNFAEDHQVEKIEKEVFMASHTSPVDRYN